MAGLVRRLPLPLRKPLIDLSLAGVSALRLNNRFAAGRTPPAPGPLVVTGFLNEVLGVGRAGRMTVDALQKAGLNPLATDLRPHFKAWVNGKVLLYPDQPGGVWLVHANAQEAAIALLAHDPATWRSRYRIGYWVYETDPAPRGWARWARFFDEIWTPSAYSRAALAAGFAAAGRAEDAKRLRVVPHPCPDVTDAKPDRAAFGLDPDTLYAFCLFDARSSLARKNPFGAVEAYLRATPAPTPKRGLVIKASGLSEDLASVAQLKARIAGRPDIRMIEAHLSDAEMLNLLASIDIFISLHRAEGFGLGLAETLALGKSVLATGFSGPQEFLTPSCAETVGYRLVPVNDPFGQYRGGHWAEPDLEDAGYRLGRLFASAPRRRALAETGPAAAQNLNASWSATTLKNLPFYAHLGQAAAG